MPVQKFTTFEEAERALWNFKPDKEYYRQVAAFYNLFWKLNKFTILMEYLSSKRLKKLKNTKCRQ